MSKKGAKAFKAGHRTARSDPAFTKKYADGRHKSCSWRRYQARKYAQEVKPAHKTIEEALLEFKDNLFAGLRKAPANASPKKIPFGDKRL